jgi:hypothetical protein
VIGVAEPDAPAGAHLVLARVHEANGAALEHAREVEETLRADPGFWPALEDRAWVRADRGEIRAAVSDLERVADDDPKLLVLDRYSAPGPMTAGRNDPCPCGSGRKHKACCGRTNGYRLSDRAPLLFEKAMWFASRPPQRDAVMAMIDEACSGTEIDLSFVPEELLVSDPVLLHIALFASGIMSRFRDERGVLLPDDERSLVACWADAVVRPLRVEHVDDRDVLVADLSTGAELRLRHHGIDVSLSPGSLVAGAVLPDGEGDALLGWLSIEDDGVTKLVRDGDLRAIVRAVVSAWRETTARAILDLEATRAERLTWLFPDVDRTHRENASIAELVETDHPEFVAAIEAGRHVVPVEGGHEVDPRVHLALHEIVAQQILGDDPPEVWYTAVRLEHHGYDRHEILHMLASTVSNQVFGMLGEGRAYDRAERLEELAALPDTWELARSAHDTSHRGARHRGRHPRR